MVEGIIMVLGYGCINGKGDRKGFGLVSWEATVSLWATVGYYDRGFWLEL
jgi:hypothetical protein